MHAHLTFNYKKATQCLNFLAVQSGGIINKMKAIKLIWLADRYHLRKYGRPITKDEYFAMDYGPVNSGVKELAEMSGFLGQVEIDYASKYITPLGRYNLQSVEPVENDVFSETDFEALAFAWEKFGKHDQFRLRDISHNYPEWKRFEEVLENQSRIRMNYEDFLEDPPGGFEKCYTLSEEDKKDRLEQLEETAKLNALWNAF